MLEETPELYTPVAQMYVRKNTFVNPKQGRPSIGVVLG
jgi:hypothetical protein